jgi:hypothetical protein
LPERGASTRPIRRPDSERYVTATPDSTHSSISPGLIMTWPKAAMASRLWIGSASFFTFSTSTTTVRWSRRR